MYTYGYKIASVFVQYSWFSGLPPIVVDNTQHYTSAIKLEHKINRVSPNYIY